MSFIIHNSQSTKSNYQQSVFKKRIWTYWVRWLGWAGCLSWGSIYASDVPNMSHENGQSNAGHGVYCWADSPSVPRCDEFFLSFNHLFTTPSYTGHFYIGSWFIALPDSSLEPIGSHKAYFYNNPEEVGASSLPPTVKIINQCNGTSFDLWEDANSVMFRLNTNGTCSINFAPRPTNKPYSHIFLSGSITRTGHLYSFSNGKMCGSPFSECPVLTTTTAGAGSGTVTDNSPHQNGRFAINAQVELTATPASGSVFAGWSGDAGCANSFNIGNANKTCTATFNISPIPASLLNFNQPTVIYSKEIGLIE